MERCFPVVRVRSERDPRADATLERAKPVRRIGTSSVGRQERLVRWIDAAARQTSRPIDSFGEGPDEIADSVTAIRL